MRFHSLAVWVAASMLGLISPAFAADQPDTNFKLPIVTSFGILHNGAALAPLPPDPSPAPAPAPQSSGKQLTRTGRVLKWVGIGCMAQGGVDIIVGAATPGARGPWIGTGVAFAAVGAVLYEVGIHKTE